MGGRGGSKRFTFRYVRKVREEIEKEFRIADIGLQSDIDVVDQTVDTIMSGSTESLDAFVEVVQAFQTADDENAGSITALAVTAQQDRAAIRSEFAAADTSLQGNIVTEASARLATDATLQAGITTEAALRVSSNTLLQNNITAEAALRAVTDTTLQASITAEAILRATADTSLQGDITSETTTRLAAVATLQGNIDAIEISSSEVAGMNMILAGPNGKKYHFSIDDNGTPSVEEITSIEEVPDTNVILSTPGGDRYRFGINAEGIPYVEIVV